MQLITSLTFLATVQQVVYSSSVDIRPEWVVKEQIPFTSLLKLNYQVSEPEDLKFCGKLQYYDKSLDRITPRLEKPLQRTKKTFRSVTTSDDPVIRYPPFRIRALVGAVPAGLLWVPGRHSPQEQQAFGSGRGKQ